MPIVVRRCRPPTLVRVTVAADESSGVRGFKEKCGPVCIKINDARGDGQITHAESTFAKDSGCIVAGPRLRDRGNAHHGRKCMLTGCAFHAGRIMLGRHERRGWPVDRVSRFALQSLANCPHQAP